MAYHVRINAWYMCFQYNIVNCKAALIWSFLCRWLQPASGTERENVLELDGISVCAVVMTCWGICINYSILILILKHNKPSTLAAGPESDGVWKPGMGQRCRRNILWGAFSESASALNNENAFTLQILSLLKQEGSLQRQRATPDGNLNLQLNEGSPRQ